MRPHLTNLPVWQKKDAAALLIALVLAGAVSWPIFRANVFDPGRLNDFADHVAFAGLLAEGREIPPHILAHSLLQWLILLVSRVLGVSVQWAALGVMVGANLVSTLLVFGLVRGRGGQTSAWTAAGAAAAMLFASPLAVYLWQDGYYYLGYVGVVTFHNPTIILLRPLALVNFMLLPQVIGEGRAPAWVFWAAAITSLLAAFIKPNYAICALPVLGLAAGAALLRGKTVRWGLIAGGFVIPTVGMLAWQFLTTYGDESGGILFAPLAVMRSYTTLGLPLRFLSSIWFPLLTCALFWRAAREDALTRWGWAVFALGAFYTYFMAEGGERFQHGNFGWSGEIALYLLFAAVLALLARQSRGWRWWVCWLAGLLPHAAFGAAYYTALLGGRLFY